MTRAGGIATALFALAAIACDGFTVVCISAGGTLSGTTLTGSESLVAEVRDGASGAPAATGATMVVQTATSVESVQGSADDLFLAWGTEQSGRVDVTVRKPGYQDWYRRDVPIVHGGCRPGGAYLQVWLRVSD